MHKLGLVLCLLLFWVSQVSAQDVDLTAENVQIERRLDAFGYEVEVITGFIVNQGDQAASNINIYADLVTEDGDVIGEGFGFIVDACGTALVDEALQPGQSQAFLANVDLFGEGDPSEIQVFLESQPTEPGDIDPIEIEAITQIADAEVVAVEWIDDDSLRFGVGCDARVFTSYEWSHYDIDETVIPLEAHPATTMITDTFLAQTGINQLTQSREEDLTLFDRSFLTFPTQSERIVYQTDIHTLVTAERDGSFKRVVHELLHQYSLRGFIWTPAGNFLAYYYGAYGDPVRYITAASSGGLISAVLTASTPSVTVPGLYNDGRRVIIGGTFADITGEEVAGYWLSNTLTHNRELLFEVDALPGNNFPAPAYYRKDADTRYIYVIRPIDEQVTLQCYFREGDELITLTELPLQLGDDERAWSWLSPNYDYLAIAANGTHGGLWLVDLNAFEECR